MNASFFLGALLAYWILRRGIPGIVPPVPVPPVPVPPVPLPGGGTIPWPTLPPGWGIPGVTPQPTTPQPTTPQPQPGQLQTYVIKSGDYASGLAKKKTGDGSRWREILTVNPEMSTYTDKKGATQIRPWNVGQTMFLPPGWA